MRVIIQHIKALFGCVFLISFITSCDPGDGKLIILNGSNDTIYYATSSNDTITYCPIKRNENGKVDLQYSSYISANNQINVGVLGKWEEGINASTDSSLRIFIFTKTLIRNTCDSILKYQLYSKKYKLKVADLEKLNWRVIYNSKQ